jgi:predicted heme/steroid binding protein
MQTSERIVSLAELRRSTGERGTPMFVAHNGIVYDLTDCPRWKKGLHEQMHFPGQDLTGELDITKHGEEVFKRPCVKVVGRLAS